VWHKNNFILTVSCWG